MSKPSAARRLIHMSDSYRPLRYLEGADVKIVHGIDFDVLPTRVKLTKDYGRKIMLELTFTGSIWGLNVPPRTYKRMVLKQSLVCGDVKLATMDGRPIEVGQLCTQEGEVINETEH